MTLGDKLRQSLHSSKETGGSVHSRGEHSYVLVVNGLGHRHSATSLYTAVACTRKGKPTRGTNCYQQLNTYMLNFVFEVSVHRAHLVYASH